MDDTNHGFYKTEQSPTKIPRDYDDTLTQQLEESRQIFKGEQYGTLTHFLELGSTYKEESTHDIS